MKIAYPCKQNYAVNVKAILPGLIEYWAWRDNSETRFEIVYLRSFQIGLTTRWSMYIIVFTYIATGGRYAAENTRGYEGEQPARTGNTQPTPSLRNRPAVCIQRVLRPTGSGAGEIRDATVRSDGWALGYRGGKGIRIFKTLLLPGPGGLRRGRIGRPRTAEARAQNISQAHRRGHGLPTRVEAKRPIDSSDGTRQSCQGTLRYHGASSNGRARTGPRQKKTLSVLTSHASARKPTRDRRRFTNNSVTISWPRLTAARHQGWQCFCLKGWAPGYASGPLVCRKLRTRRSQLRLSAGQIANWIWRLPDLTNNPWKEPTSLPIFESKSQRY